MADAEQFRRLAMALPGAEERSHMAHPDFRVSGKVFASLGHPDRGHAMVALTPEQQELAAAAEPEAFRPAAGQWGTRGSTLVRLDAVSDEWLGRALRWAWEKRAAPSPRRKPGVGDVKRSS